MSSNLRSDLCNAMANDGQNNLTQCQYNVGATLPARHAQIPHDKPPTNCGACTISRTADVWRATELSCMHKKSPLGHIGVTTPSLDAAKVIDRFGAVQGNFTTST